MSDRDPAWNRRALDRAEQRMLELEKQIQKEVDRCGVPTYNQAINLAIAYLARARERKARDQATPEDLRILKTASDMGQKGE